MLKKLAIALVTFGALAIATPAVFACPGHEDKDKSAESAPKTADNDKSQKAPAPTKKDDKKPAKKTDKKAGDKVSMK